MKYSYFKYLICLLLSIATSSLLSQTTPAGGTCTGSDCLAVFSWTEHNNNPHGAAGLASDANCATTITSSLTYTGNDPDPVFDNVSFNADNQVAGSGTVWTDVWVLTFSTQLTDPVLAFDFLFTDTGITITDCADNPISLTQLSDNSTLAGGAFSGNNEVQLSGTYGCIKVSLTNDKSDGYEVQVKTCLSPGAPEINVKDGGADVACGASSTTIFDGGNVDISSGNALIDVTIQNTGNQPLNITDLNITGTDAGDFTTTSTASSGSPIIIAPSTSMNIVVTFDPSSIGAKSASFSIVSDDNDEATCIVPLNGTGTTPPSNISALATCTGITAANENKYHIVISGLNAALTYDFDIGGTAITGITGSTSYTTTTPINFTNGTAVTTVTIDEGQTGTPQTTVKVHEVLCTDADDDGDIDFDSGCDLSSGAADQGYIVATSAPYTGDNQYVYVLTNVSDDVVEAANYSGLFTSLASGGNGNTDDYNVIRFNFGTLAQAATFLGTLTNGTSVVTSADMPAGCFMQCGSQSYNIECCVEPVITNPGDQTVCDSYTLPTITGTNLTGNQKYYDDTQANGGSVITGTITTTTTVYIYDEYNNSPSCSDEESFVVTVNNTPEITNPGDQTVCDAYTLPTITGINLTGNEKYYDNSQASGSANEITGPITSTTTVYIYDATSSSPVCSDEESFVVTVTPSPVITNPGDQTACDSYTLPAIVGTDLTGNEKYYDNSQASGSANEITGPITSTTTVYIYDATSTSPVCSDEESFVVTINDSPTISADPIDASTCSAAVNQMFDVTAAEGVGSDDDLEYQWEISTDGGTTWSNSASTGSDTNTITVTGAELANGNMFRVVVSEGNNPTCTVTSAAATLTITSVSCGTFPWNGQ